MWIAYHLFYHGDRTGLLLDHVRPLVEKVLEDGIAESFFFIRYGLGGPHLRLRFRCPAGREDLLRQVVEEECRCYLAAHPARDTVSEDEILAANRPLLDYDPNEDDEGVYPNNSLARFEFRPEQERYGGADNLELSLRLFAASSAQALEILAASRGAPSAKWLPKVIEVWALQAFLMARERRELAVVSEYARDYWGDALVSLQEKGDRVFESNAEALTALVRRTLSPEHLRRRLELPDLFRREALRFSRGLSDLSEKARCGVMSSHLHMVANRLGLLNPEEAYAGRIFSRAVQRLSELEPEWWEEAQAAVDESCEQLPEAEQGKAFSDALLQALREGGLAP